MERGSPFTSCGTDVDIGSRVWFCDREPVQDGCHRAQAGPATVIEQLCLCRTAAAIPSDEALQLSNVNIRLPWPDRYELTLNFGCHSQTASRSFSVSMAVASRDQRSTLLSTSRLEHIGVALCALRTVHLPVCRDNATKTNEQGSGRSTRTQETRTDADARVIRARPHSQHAHNHRLTDN